MGEPTTLSVRDRRVMLAAAVFGWLCAGVEMGLGPLISRPAARDLIYGPGLVLDPASEAIVGKWFAWFMAAFLVGGAVGGAIFGRLGDRAGRVRAMGWSIVCFSVFTGAGWFASSPEQMLILRFFASLGIGGMWPAGVALVSETWTGASRPMVAGAMGLAANVGILVMALIGQRLKITPESWRWAMLVGTAPVVLGIAVLAAVPESPRWLAGVGVGGSSAPLLEVLRPPLLKRTFVGTLLGAVPLLGAWASQKWIIPWADAAGENAAGVQAIWAAGAVIGGALGGYVGDKLGRRRAYFVVSLASFGLNLAVYRFMSPTDTVFRPTVFALGLVATLFFGWLPLYLPELFPTRVRATGSGVTFNAGRIASAVGVLAAGQLLLWFEGNYARVGATAAWVYALGMVVVPFAPDTRGGELRN
ncbi:MAG: MFS transporter [Gemmataceae bacterium]